MKDKDLYIYCNIALVLAAFISGLSFVAQKLGMHYVQPFTFNALRCFIGCIALLPLIWYKEEYPIKPLLKGGGLAGFVLFIAFTINQYCMIYADAGKAGFITSLYILFVPVIAVFLKHKLQPNVWLSIFIAIIGLYLLCAKGTMSFEVWDIFLLVSAFFFALHIIIVSHYSKKTDTTKLSALQFLVAGILSTPFMLFMDKPTIPLILAGWKPILFIGTVVTAGAYTLQIFGHKATKPVLATLILSSEAVFAVICGMAFLGETLSIRETVGCVVMLTAIIISQLSTKGGKYDSNNF